MSNLTQITAQVTQELGNQETVKTLLATTFKGFQPPLMKQAILEGMIRGFEFKDFLEKNVYAIAYGQSYSLITSIDYARKIAMRSGLAGKSAPTYEFGDNKEVISCSVTVKRNSEGVVGEYTATVYFDEFNTKKNLWISKPKVMIAKVAEMHALRSAFPEEMSKQYIEEEMEKEVIAATPVQVVIDIVAAKAKMDTAKNYEELKGIWSKFTADERSCPELMTYGKKLKATYKEEIKTA